jgi:hypothetical protein
MIRELLEKRISDYESTTSQILELFGDKLLKALRYYTKTEKEIHIATVRLYKNNRNFIISEVVMKLAIGDKITTNTNETHIVTAENIHMFESESLKILLPASVLEKCGPSEIHQKLKEMDDFIKAHGMDKLHKCIGSGILDLDELLNPENETLLDQLTDPIETIIDGFDDLQKAQYMLFSSSMSKVVH